MTPDLRAQLEASIGDQYTLSRELPRGGMSRVFAAREKALGRTVVIKVLSPQLVATLSAARFKREIQLAARLQHPHIVPLLTAGQTGDSLYFTMPLVEGESLRERINRERPMAIENVARILEEVAGALEYAHTQGIVHRDIKPENVMFFHESAVVLDFGIGKALTAASDTSLRDSSTRITQSGMSLGTPTYISPEQATGDIALDHRADIYSLGVVAYEMLTGHPPFAARTPQAIIAAHAEQLPAPVVNKRPDAPDALAMIVMKCLAKNPNDRPQTAADIVRAIRGTPGGGQPRVAAPSIFSRIPLWVPWVIAATATVVAMVTAVVAMR